MCKIFTHSQFSNKLKIALENGCFQELFSCFYLILVAVKYIYEALENEDIGRYKKRWSKKGASKSIGELTVLPIAPLTESEEGDRLHLERKVERAFYEAGMALMQLRDRRLYRTTHPTFEEYCRDRFNYTRRRPIGNKLRKSEKSQVRN